MKYILPQVFVVSMMFFCIITYAGKPEISAGDYQARLSKNGFVISYKNEIISQGSELDIVEGPGWKKTLVGKGFFHNVVRLKKWTVSKNKLIVNHKQNGVAVSTGVEVYSDRVVIFAKYNSGNIPLQATSWWVMALPEKTNAQCFFERKGGKKKRFPVAALDAKVKKSLWRLSADSKEFTVYSKIGIIKIKGNFNTYFFGARFHSFLLKPLRTFLLRAVKIPQNKRLEYTIKVEKKQMTAEPRSIAIESTLLTPKCRRAPEIDADLDDPVWKNIEAQELQVLRKRAPKGRKPQNRTLVKTTYDRDNLYIAFKCFEKNLEKLPGDTKDKKHMWEAECVEVFLTPVDKGNYQFVILNIHGQLMVSYRGAKPGHLINPDSIKRAVKIDKDGWSAEMAIPFREIGFIPKSGKSLVGNLARENHLNNEYSSWADMDNSFHENHRFRRIVFKNVRASVRRCIAINDSYIDFFSGWNNIPLTIKNHSNSPLRVVSGLIMTNSRKDKLKNYFSKAQTLKGSGVANIDVRFKIAPDDTQFYLVVKDADTGKDLYVSSPYNFTTDSLVGKAVKLLGTLKKIRAYCKENQLKTADDNCGKLEKTLIALNKKAAGKLDKLYWDDLHRQIKTISMQIAKIELLVQRNEKERLSKDFFISPEISCKKIFTNIELPQNVSLDKMIKMSGAGGEYVSCQLIVAPLFSSLNDFKIRSSSLNLNADVVIPEKNIKLYKERNVLLGKKLWPDILSKNIKGNILLKDNFQVFWLTVKIPRNSKAGNYKANISFGAKGLSEQNVAFELKVYDFNVPQKSKILAFGHYYENELKRCLKNYSPEMEKQWIDFVIEHNVYPSRAIIHPRHIDTFNQGLDKFTQLKLDKFDFIRSSQIPWLNWLERFYIKYPNSRYKNVNDFYENIFQQQVKNAEKLRKLGKLDKAYVYYDEVLSNQKIIKDLLLKIKKATGMKTMMFMDKPHLGPDYVKYYEDCTDLLVFSNGYFSNKKLLKYIDSLRLKGKKIGWYFNRCYPDFPTFNVIDAPAMAHRMQFWLQWKYKIYANVFWGLNFWLESSFKNSPFKLDQRGNGLLTYPDDDGSFTTSIRFELLRESIQDYRYLELLDSYVKQAGKSDRRNSFKGLIAKARKLLKLDWAGGIVSYPKNPEIMLKHRTQIAKCIVKFKKALK